MGAIPSGKGGECFPQLPPQRPDLGASGGGGGRRRPLDESSGRGGVRERKGGWGRGGRRRPRTLVLSRQPAWRDKSYAGATKRATPCK